MIATVHPHPETDAAAAALRDELEGLVRVAARRPNLTVREGQPGCPWSFNFESDVVTVDPDSLRSLAPDLCRGLALHEAAHAAVTVLHDILPPATITRLHPLLNTLEDIRIEIWMRARFPGAAPWIRAYNDLFYGLARRMPLPQSRQVQFLKGVLDLWWYGTTTPGTLAEVEAALDTCREPITLATACQPPLADDRPKIISSQRSMWGIVRERILPIWERLVLLDRRDGLGRLASHELREFVEATGGASGGRLRSRLRASRPAQRGSRVRSRTLPRHAAGRRRHDGRRPAGSSDVPGQDPGSGGDARQRIAASLGTDGSDAYLAAWKRVGPLADRLGDELLRVLVPRHRLRWQAGHPTGPRLDLRRAMQFEADPRLYASLWSRPLVPTRRNPAVVLLVDRSGSMAADGRIERSFEGLVLLVEVCRRAGVPAAVWSFADMPREELSWETPLDRATRHRLGRLPQSCDGNTDMTAALLAVRRAFAARHGDPKLLFMLSDGEPDQVDPTLESVGKLEADGVTPFGLGLGPGTAGLGRFFRRAATVVKTPEIVGKIASLLENALVG
jgi:hypothetical protein